MSAPETGDYRRGYEQAKADADVMYGEDGAGHVARRGSDVEAWIKRARDEFLRPDGGRPLRPTMAGAAYDDLDDLLDDYRMHADTGTPLSEPVTGPHPEED